MAHDLAQTASGEYMTAWAGSTPWHGLGTSVEGLMTTTEALQKAHLDWQVVKLPLWFDISNDYDFDMVSSVRARRDLSHSLVEAKP